MADGEQEIAPKPKRKRAAKREAAERDARIVRAPAHEGPTAKRVRDRVAARIEKRDPDPSEDFVAVRIARLGEAMQFACAVKVSLEDQCYQGLALTLARRAGSGG